MAMQARRVQTIIACNLIARLTRSKPSVNFSALDVLTCAAFSGQATQPFIQPTLVGDDLVPTPDLLFGCVCAEGEVPMKSKWESPTAQNPSAPSEPPTLHRPRRRGVEVSALMRAAALTAPSGTSRSVTWPRAAART